MNRVKSYKHLATRLFDTPLLVCESKLNVILRGIGPECFGIEEIQRNRIMEDDEGGAYTKEESFLHLEGILSMSADVQFKEQAEGHITGGGIAVIPVFGTLIQRGSFMSSFSGMTSYDQVERMFAAAMNDPAVREIVAEYDTPGGEVAGAFDTADRLSSLRGKGKKITAVASEFAASAGYLLASTADEIVVPRTGAVGSIGVVAAHYDYSKAMEKKGVAVTFVYAGDKKVQGNPYQKLSEEAQAEWQDEINGVYDLFVNTVATNRGMSADAVRATQAAMFTGSKAVSAGLANRVNSFGNELGNAVIRQKSNSSFMRINQPEKETQMSEEEKKAADLRVQQAEDAKMKAENEAATAKADAAKASKDAVAADRERTKAILNCEEAKGRETLAQQCVDMELSVEDAKKMLAAAPKAKPGSKFDAAMDAISKNGGTPNIEGAALPERKVDLEPEGVYARREKIYKSYGR